jgi:hypothetical protein
MMQRFFAAIVLSTVAAENYADSTYFPAKQYRGAAGARASERGHPYVTDVNAMGATALAFCPHFSFGEDVKECGGKKVASNVAGGALNTWGGHYPTCNYNVNPFQSPIDIRTGSSEMREGAFNLPEVHISLDAGLYGGLLHNDGRNLLIDYTRKTNRVMLSDSNAVSQSTIANCPVPFRQPTAMPADAGLSSVTQMMSFDDSQVFTGNNPDKFLDVFSDTCHSYTPNAAAGSAAKFEYSSAAYPLDKYSISGGPIAPIDGTYHGQQFGSPGKFGVFKQGRFSLDSVVFKIGKSEHTVSGTAKKGEIQLKFTRASSADATVLGSIQSFTDRVRAFRPSRKDTVVADYTNPFVLSDAAEPILSLKNFRLKTCEGPLLGAGALDVCVDVNQGRSQSCGVGYSPSCGKIGTPCVAGNSNKEMDKSSTAATTHHSDPIVIPGINDEVVYYSILVDEFSGTGNYEIENLISYKQFPTKTFRNIALPAAKCAAATCPLDNGAAVNTAHLKPDYHQLSFNVSSILPEDYSTDYYSYEGSVPVPPCNAATWIIAGKTLKLTKKQIEFFESVSSDDNSVSDTTKISMNVRAVQKIRMRRVTRRRADGCAAPASDSNDDFLSSLFGGGSSFYG